MKTTVKELTKKVYLVTFDLFEASRMMNMSYSDMQSLFCQLRNMNVGKDDMYGRVINNHQRAQYNGHDHYDFTCSPDFIIRTSGIRMDSEEAIVSIKLEVLNEHAFPASAPELATYFNEYGWRFVPRCFYVNYEVEDAKFENPIRSYVGQPKELSKGWVKVEGVNYRTIDIWIDDETGTELGENPEEDIGVSDSDERNPVIIVDQTHSEIIKMMLCSGYNFSTVIDGKEVHFEITGPKENSNNPYAAKLDEHCKDLKGSFKQKEGYAGPTFTPEQPKHVPNDPTRSMWGPE
ncbi:hypothetical protein KODAMA_02250 [Serratia phage vB_SmaM-Kodama]|nr:hypothetical protein KODAMA_02250 [Serratia phage vB_SmaM-Kodama]